MREHFALGKLEILGAICLGFPASHSSHQNTILLIFGVLPQ